MLDDATLADLREILGDRLVTTDADRALHGQNEAWFAQSLPDAVAYPRQPKKCR